MNAERKLEELSRARTPADGRHIVTLLSGIYLEVGLPLEAAVRSAIADYECGFGLTGYSV